MSEVMKKVLADAVAKYGPIPTSFTFGDGIDWSSEIVETFLYAELPFWLMVKPGTIDLQYGGAIFPVDITSQWMEVYAGEIVDSKRTVVHNGPWASSGWQPSPELAEIWAEDNLSWLQRPTKTVVRIRAYAHTDAFRPVLDNEPPRVQAEHEAYWASLCQAHIPIINSLIQQYRLVTYDYYAYEVSPWDVPVWWIKHQDVGYRAVLLPYKEWDRKPVIVEDGDGPGSPPKLIPFEWTTIAEMDAAAGFVPAAGEFDLLDARSLMERGDYTGAVRRSVTAVEALLRAVLIAELEKDNSSIEAERLASKTDNDFPGRLRQWRRLSRTTISQAEFDEFEATRQMRHEIVHRGLHLTHHERGRAQRAVDTTRWLFNKMEAKPDRARLRDYGVLKSVGRSALAIRFPDTIKSGRIMLHQLD